MKKIYALCALCFGINLASYSQWSDLSIPSTSTYFKSITFTSATTGFMTGDKYNSGTGLSDARIYKTTNGASTWSTSLNLVSSSTTPTNSYELRDIQFVTSMDGFAAGENYVYGFICVTNDGGTTWDTTSLSSFMHRFMAIHFFDVNNGIAGTSEFGGLTQGELFKTSDGGMTWTSVSVNTIGAITDIEFPTSLIGFASTYRNPGGTANIMKTIDGGNTWTSVHTETMDIMGVSFISATTGFGVTYTGTLIKTTDGGTTWTSSTVTGASNAIGIQFVTSSIGYVGTTGSFTTYIKKTTDGGTTWTTDHSISGFFPYADFAVTGTTAYAIPNQGTDLAKTTSFPSSILETELSLVNIQVGPNPANDNFSLLFNDPELSIESTILTDLSGNVVSSFTNQLNFSVANLSDGVYIASIKTNKGLVKKQILVSR